MLNYFYFNRFLEFRVITNFIVLEIKKAVFQKHMTNANQYLSN